LIGESRVMGFDAIGLTTVTAASMLALSSVWLWRDNVLGE